MQLINHNFEKNSIEVRNKTTEVAHSCSKIVQSILRFKSESSSYGDFFKGLLLSDEPLLLGSIVGKN